MKLSAPTQLWMAAIAVALARLLPPDPAHERPPQRNSLLSRHAGIYRSPRLAAPAMGFCLYSFLQGALLALLPRKPR